MFFDAGHCVVCQRGRAEGIDRHRLQNLSCPLRGARGSGNVEAERAEAHEQLGPPFVHVWVQLGGDEGVGARARVDRENLLGGQRGKELASAIGGAGAALPGEAMQEDRGQGRVDAHRVVPRSGYSPTRASPGSSAAVAEGNQEARCVQGPSTHRPRLRITGG